MLQAVDGEQDINRRHDNQQHKQDVQEIGYGSFPERRKHLYIEHARVFRPDAVGIGGAHFEDIIPLRQVGIGSRSLLAYVVPRLLKAVQDIGILYVGRVGIVEYGILEGEDILPVRECQFPGIVQALQ